MKFDLIDIDEIEIHGPQAAQFSFAFEFDVVTLSESIQRVGLINPPRLRRAGENFEVICGCRRVRACKHLQYQNIPALFYEQGELSDEQCLWLSLIDTEWTGRWSPVEQAIALQKFSALGYPLEKLVADVVTHLNLPRSREYIEKHLRLLSLESEVLKALHSNHFGVEQAFMLLPVEPESRGCLFDLLRSCKANLNETKELIPLIMDVAAISNMRIVDFVHQELNQTLLKEIDSPRRRLQALRGFLTKKRYPTLSSAESNFKKIVEELGVGDRIRIDSPRHFEGDDLTITIRATSPEQLVNNIKEILNPTNEQKIASLFSVLQQNKPE